MWTNIKHEGPPWALYHLCDSRIYLNTLLCNYISVLFLHKAIYKYMSEGHQVQILIYPFVQDPASYLQTKLFLYNRCRYFLYTNVNVGKRMTATMFLFFMKRLIPSWKLLFPPHYADLSSWKGNDYQITFLYVPTGFRYGNKWHGFHLTSWPSLLHIHCVSFQIWLVSSIIFCSWGTSI